MRKFILAAALLVPVITFVSNVIAQPGSTHAGSGLTGDAQVTVHQAGSVSPDQSALEGHYKKLGK